MVDYLVVGLGLAGISFCEQLEKNKKTYNVITDDSQRSSVVAGGLYNPIILKRFTLAWNADNQLEEALPFYRQLEEKLDVVLDFETPILRKFASIEEQNAWFEASDKSKLDKFLSTDIIENNYENIDAPLGFGKVRHTGRVDTKKLVTAYETFLADKGFLVRETFDFNLIKTQKNHVEYKSIKTTKVVFATGFGLKMNPYFNYLPLQGSKGELITIKAPKLKLQDIVKSSVFIIPLGDGLYRVGATYERIDKSNDPTKAAKNELLKKLHSFLKCEYEIIKHVAGVRPTVADRRPLVGRHPEHKNFMVLNGFGSRGVLMAPTIARQLYEHIEKGETLPPEIDVARFSKRYITGKS
jgi:glycine/D-amino acid oxidase-like deaminating enzyme